MTREQKYRPYYQYGFWWWYNPTRKDWCVGCAPCIGRPPWAEVKKN